MRERELQEWLLELQLENNRLEKEKEDLEAEIDELKYNLDYYKDKIQEMEQDIEDNYRPIPISQQVGISDKDFI